MAEEEKAKGKPRRHRRGEGSTYPVSDGGWMAALCIGYDRRTGKRRMVRRRAPDSDGADHALVRLRREWGIAGEVAFVRLDDYLAEWLSQIKPSVAPRTYVSYAGHVDLHISPLLGAMTVGSLRAKDVHRLIRASLDKGVKPSTVGRIVVTLRMALGQAVRDGELSVNVAQVKLPRVERDPVEALTEQQAQNILDIVEKHWIKPLVTLLLGTGMRVGEACALDWRDVDLEGASVLVRKGKTRAARRRIPLPPFVVKVLREHRAASPRVGPSEPVFIGERISRKTRARERMTTSAPTHAFPLLMERAKQPRMTIHQLRHGTATLLVAKGVPMRVVSEILGHSNPSFTAQVYAHVSDASKRSAMDELTIGKAGEPAATEPEAAPESPVAEAG